MGWDGMDGCVYMFTVKQANSFFVCTSSAKQIRKRYCRAFKCGKAPQAASESSRRSRTASLLVLAHMCSRALPYPTISVMRGASTILNDFKRNTKQFDRNVPRVARTYNCRRAECGLAVHTVPSKAFHNLADSALTSAQHTNCLIASRPDQICLSAAASQ